MPFMKISRSSIRSVIAPCNKALMAGIERISSTLFAVRSLEFELVSDTHELTPFHSNSKK